MIDPTDVTKFDRTEAEKAFLDLADANKMSPADYDLMIWNQYARKA